MENIRSLEDYPPCMVFASLLVSLSIYAFGTVILSSFGAIPAMLYTLFCIGNEFHIMKTSCTRCYYYGKLCAFGKGKVAALLFKQGDASEFAARTITWKDLIPDMLVTSIPLVGGIAILIRDFSWTMVLMIAILLALSFGGNYLVRSRIACKYCKQRELGCPAEQLFSKTS